MNILKGLGNRGKRETSGTLSGQIKVIQTLEVKIDSILAEGASGIIYRATDLTSSDSERPLVLKYCYLGDDADVIDAIEMEIMALQLLRPSPYVLNLLAYSRTPTEAFLITDYCPMSLADHLQRTGKSPLSDDEILSIFLQVARGLSAMHQLKPPIAHRDVKAENILKTQRGTWVLCDFGSASRRHQVFDDPRDLALEEEVIRKKTTPVYRAPELWNLYSREFIGTKVDVWALGVLLYFMAYKRLPFTGDSSLQIIHASFDLPSTRSQPLCRLIELCLTPKVQDRPDVDAVISDALAISNGHASHHGANNNNNNNRNNSIDSDFIAAGGPGRQPSPTQQQWEAFGDENSPHYNRNNTSTTAGGDDDAWAAFNDFAEPTTSQHSGPSAPGVFAHPIVNNSNTAASTIITTDGTETEQLWNRVGELERHVEKLQEEKGVLEQVLSTVSGEADALRKDNERYCDEIGRLRSLLSEVEQLDLLGGRFREMNMHGGAGPSGSGGSSSRKYNTTGRNYPLV